MKHIRSYFLGIVIFLMPACSIINETPVDSIAASTYFQNYKDVEAAVISTYSVLTGANSYGRLRILATELSSNNIEHRINQFEFAHFSDHQLIAENIVLFPIWSEIYKGIMRANDVIAAVPKLDPKNQELSKNFLGEAYFLRAFMYFDLVRMFGDVPLVSTPSNNVDLNAVRVARTESQKIYAQIVADLQEAEKLLPESYAIKVQNRGRATKMTAKAYLAKVFLYQKDYTNCLAKLDEVINNTANYGLVSLDILYNTNDNLETVFELFFSIDGISLQLLPSIAPYNGFGEYYVNTNLLKLFDSQDKRLAYMIQNNGNWFAAKARKAKTTTADPVYCLRLAELLLIRAEVLARNSGTPTPKAIEALNLVRQRAGLEAKKMTDFANLDSFLETVLIEKRKEVMFETGDFWFDAIRAGYASKLLGVSNPNAYLYPIPNAEIVRNPNLTQNAGY